MAESPTVQCMTACFRDGQVLEVGLLSAVELAVLGTAQCALSRDPLTAPLSWVEHDRFRHGCSDSGECPSRSAARHCRADTQCSPHLTLTLYPP